MRKINITALVILALLLVCGVMRPAYAQETPTAEKLWESITKINPGLKDYSVGINIKVKAKYHFLNPKLDLEGTYYFKKPDHHKLKLKRASYFLKKYPKIFGWSLPELKHFNTKVVNTTLNGQPFYLVTLTPKTIAGDIVKEEIWVSQKNYTFPKHTYHYKNGGNIKLEIDYRKEGGYTVYNRMKASFSFPKEKLNATSDARYGKYKFNTGLSDDFFKQN